MILNELLLLLAILGFRIVGHRIVVDWAQVVGSRSERGSFEVVGVWSATFAVLLDDVGVAVLSHAEICLGRLERFVCGSDQFKAFLLVQSPRVALLSQTRGRRVAGGADRLETSHFARKTFGLSANFGGGSLFVARRILEYFRFGQSVAIKGLVFVHDCGVC